METQTPTTESMLALDERLQTVDVESATFALG